MKGTDFQIKVWKELERIPVGETRTYKEIAEAVGCPNSYRAVANACSANPNPIIIPCHRVVRSNGALGGYSGVGGVVKKREILESEGVILANLQHH